MCLPPTRGDPESFKDEVAEKLFNGKCPERVSG
jgi:hypothetical protein